MEISVNVHKEKWVENFARFGIASKGVTYLLIGVLSAITAFKGSSNGLDKHAAVKEIWKQPYGHVVLMLLVIGFLGYVMWRWIQAFKDPENKGTDAKGLAKRIAYGVSGALYASLAFYCIKLLIGSSQGGSKQQFFLNSLLKHDGGQVVVGILALIVIGYGIYQVYQGYTNKFREEVNDLEVNDKVRSIYTLLGKIGFISRGIVLMLMGFFLAQAAFQADPKEAEGSDGVLGFLYQQGGPLLMAAIAIGVAGYGLFMLVKARYQTLKL